MIRIFMIFMSLFFMLSVFIACSSNDNPDKSGAVSEDSEETVADGEAESEDKSEEGDDDKYDITLEIKGEEITGKNEGDGFVIKSGTNLTVPNEFPSDIPLPDGISINSTTVGEEGSEAGHGVQIRYEYEGDLTLEEVQALYQAYFESSGFENVEIKDSIQANPTLVIYSGTKDGETYTVDISEAPFVEDAVSGVITLDKSKK